MAIKVKATRTGYYHHMRRKEGAEFIIRNDKEFSNLWMEKVSDVSDSYAPGLDDETHAEVAMGLATKDGNRKNRRSKKEAEAKDSDVI